MEKYAINKLGGIDPESNPELERARDVDLITLPKNITGTNCRNCKWSEPKSNNLSYCKHPRVKQYVNKHMCCVLWTAYGEQRAFEKRLKQYE